MILKSVVLVQRLQTIKLTLAIKLRTKDKKKKKFGGCFWGFCKGKPYFECIKAEDSSPSGGHILGISPLDILFDTYLVKTF